MDSIDFWAARVRALEERVEAARQAALKAHPAPSFFAFFRFETLTFTALHGPA